MPADRIAHPGAEGRRPPDPRANQYLRSAAAITSVEVWHASEKAATVAAEKFWRRKAVRASLESQWHEHESIAAAECSATAALYEAVLAELLQSLGRVATTGSPRIQGKVEDERARVTRAQAALAELRRAVAVHDFGAAGKALKEADKELWSLGSRLLLELRNVSVNRELHERLAANQAARREARASVERIRRADGEREALIAAVAVHRLVGEALDITAEILEAQLAVEARPDRMAKVGADNAIRLLLPQELERLDDVGGLEQVKQRLMRTLSARLERPEEAARYGVGTGNVLLYGPPGTGKTLLARAIAGQFGLKFLRVAPAVIASPYAHETARNLARLFDLARRSVPCMLFLDEIDSLGAARTGHPSAEHREIVSQLLTLLDDCRTAQRLVVMAATNAVDLLDPALREGRFDSRIPVPLPDVDTRRQVLEIHLRRRADAVAWTELDLDEVAKLTAGRSGAALEAMVAVASEHALQHGGRITQVELTQAMAERGARDRITLEEPVHWSDVVLPHDLDERLREIMKVVQHPELADMAGIQPPMGVILHGPPGTGKTTIAKALATEVRASFYEMSAADLLSKWVGESEERVAKLFATARDNRPSIIFIDEIDGLLRRRNAGSNAPWEERVVSQFLRELDGLHQSVGVFLVGATNRLDIIDEAIKERRLMPLEVPLPDARGRRRLLDRLFARARVGAEVDMDAIAAATEGMSGADIKHLRDQVGMRALRRVEIVDGVPGEVTLTPADFEVCLGSRRAMTAAPVAAAGGLR